MIIYYVLIGLLGLCIGSFLNVVIYRVPLGMSISFPASHCTTCQTPLKWKDNIPLFSYIFLGGKCRYCKAKISPRYFIVELLNTLLYLGIALVYKDKSVVVQMAYMAAASCLICVGAIDMDTKLILHRFTVILAALGIVLTVFNVLEKDYFSNGIGLLVGFGFLGIFYLGSLLVLKREGLGLGDCLLMAAVGLLLGWRRTLLTLLVGSLVASVWLLVDLSRRNKTAESQKSADLPVAADCGSVQPKVPQSGTVVTSSQDVTNAVESKIDPGQSSSTNAVTNIAPGQSSSTNTVTNSDPSQTLSAEAEVNIDDGISAIKTDMVYAEQAPKNLAVPDAGSQTETEVEGRFREYPFAPFLCGAAALAILFGDSLIDFYLGLFV